MNASSQYLQEAEPHLLSQIKLVAFDFDGVFTDNTVRVNQDGIETVQCWRSDGLGLSRLKKLGVNLYIISTETNTVVQARAGKLKLPFRQSVEDKAEAIREVCQECGVSPDEAVFVGNDINDIPAFKTVGLPIAVSDAYPEVFPHVKYTTEKPGGYGAVREVCDIIYHAQSASS